MSLRDNTHAYILDTTAAVTVLGTWMGYLPTLAALLAILWYLVQLLESQTVKKLWAWIRRK